MPITRKFLDWTRPALVTAAEFLISCHLAGNEVDLTGVAVVVPGGRAGRRMLEILVQICEQRGLSLAPPAFVTAGALPERLYRPKKRFATDLEQRLAWMRAIAGQNRAELLRIMRHLPAENDTAAWLDLAGLLQRLHRELATDLLNFSDVRKRASEIEGFAEDDRWQILAEIQGRYLHTLDELELWDIQTARRVALEKKECEADGEILLVGTVDLSEGLRKMLDQVEGKSPGQITALIFASLDITERFDSHGCVIAEKWDDAKIEIPETAILAASDGAEQAENVVRAIAAFEGRYRADEITVGMPDEQLVPQVERLLAQCGLPVRWGPGQALSTSGPFRLLRAAGDYTRTRWQAEFAALVRHPDLARWLGKQGIYGDWLSELDTYHNAHFPARLGEEWLGFENESHLLQRLLAAVDGWLAPLVSEPRALHDWAPAIVELLKGVYGERTIDREDATDRALLVTCKKLSESFVALGQLAPSLSPRVTGAEALEIALAEVAGETIPPPDESENIELLGWLELPLDDAPTLIVTSFNDGLVPQSANADLFLPNALRTKLNLDDNARRYARDAYALSVLLASRRDLKLIVSRRDTEKNPLAPSRLLFATDDETVARRALQFFEPRPAETGRVPLSGTWAATREQFDFPIPKPMPLAKPFSQLSVTSFKTYLACPYRFYLSRVLGLRALDDAADELDGGSFGDLIHIVLQRFAKSDQCHSTDAKAISRLLEHELNVCVAATFGRRPAAAIAIQAEQMKARLDAFAAKQAERAAAGWRIEFSEEAGSEWNWPVDGVPFRLTGRIDRIDRHEATGSRAIIDYKTSDAGYAPGKTHFQGDAWIDLQLPLYRYLARGLGIEGPFDLAYALLPKDVTKTGFVVADWDEAELEIADEFAREVIRGLRNETFWPPTDPPPAFSEELAPICQDGVYKPRSR